VNLFDKSLLDPFLQLCCVAVFSEDWALRFYLDLIMIESDINALEIDLLLLLWSDLEADFEVGDRALNGELFRLLLSCVHQLTCAADLNVIGLDAEELALIERELVVEIFNETRGRLERYLEPLDGGVIT
jgi:hypothetical protein